MPRKRKTSSRKKKKDEMTYYMVKVIPITLLCILACFMIIMFLTEQFGLSPHIQLLNLTQFSNAEAVILFIVWLSVSITLGLIISFSLIQKARR